MTACDVNEIGLKALTDEVASDRLMVQVADITSESDVESVVAQAGAVDVLANVAGIMDGFVPLHDLRDDEWEKVLAVNVTGAMRLSRKVVPIMLEAKKGAIVNVVASPRPCWAVRQEPRTSRRSMRCSGSRGARLRSTAPKGCGATPSAPAPSRRASARPRCPATPST